MDYGGELRQQRDGIVERLYAGSSSSSASDHHPKTAGEKERVSPSMPQSIDRENNDNDGEGLDPYGGLLDDEQKKILEIKEQLEDSDQETDIGRLVNRLRQHSSSEVKRLVKQVLRKWKDTVDEWVKLNQPGEHASNSLMDGDSPQQKIPQNGHDQVPNFAYSLNPHNGSSGSDKNNSELERKPKAIPSRREALPKPTTPSVPQDRGNKGRAALTRKSWLRHENGFKKAVFQFTLISCYLSYVTFGLVLIVGIFFALCFVFEAKKQITIQVMDIQEIPKPKAKSAFFPKNKGGGDGSLGRHW
ncbi:hypothetical protein L484_025815 [Morus notabilis]|uniref:TFIIS N-terminal domain-containing protein n=1 Tax=Morus notabilis TaxID=981085 RepID=W9RCZ6_9ROSA|nr:hypothetical protein L484_025815 [Morus notabilis]